jgi:hypothetical protein
MMCRLPSSLLLGQKWTSWKAHSQTTSSRGPYLINSERHAINLDHQLWGTRRLTTNLHLARNCKRRQQKQGKGRKVVNDNPVRKWLVEQPAIGFFVKQLVQNGPLWGHRRICFHYHSTGECTDDCYFHNTHGEFPEKISKAYASWFTRTMKAWKQNNCNDREDDDDAESTNAPAPKRACNNNDD